MEGINPRYILNAYVNTTMYPPVLLYFNKIIKKEKFFDMSSPIFPIF
jgi:hypothetical protein